MVAAACSRGLMVGVLKGRRPLGLVVLYRYYKTKMSTLRLKSSDPFEEEGGGDCR